MENENASHPAPTRDQFEHRKDFVRAYDRWRDKHDPRRKKRVKAGLSSDEYQRADYAKHREKRLAAKKAEYETRHEEHLARQAAWRDANRDKLQARDRRRYLANPGIFRLSRAAIKRASPPWLTADHWLEMSSLYQEAMRLSEQTGELHTVDHIWPLKGKRSSGLHVPWNLQILLFADNVKKGRNEPD
jgi:hypothetical protein